MQEAKDELIEVVEFLRRPEKFQRLGGRIPKGVLLVGPPGNRENCWRGLWQAAGRFFLDKRLGVVEMIVG